ncbi:heme-binding protein, partial [Clostridium disporicum]|uniref:heme-binding protein n=1 Tax=Clostridium disporicum TaxID=84024 RepID=UPI000A614075
MSSLKYINLDIATKVMKEVENAAKELGTPIVIAIANEWGLPIAVHFMDGALPA